MNKNVTRTVGIVFLLLTLGCATTATDSKVKNSVVGLWAENSDNVNAIILRRADGTYSQRKMQRYDASKPPVSYLEKGRWRLTRDRYWFQIEDVSTPLWKSYVGRAWEVKVLVITEDSFKYLSTDGAIVEEKKLGSASDGEFERTTLNGLE